MQEKHKAGQYMYQKTRAPQSPGAWMQQKAAVLCVGGIAADAAAGAAAHITGLAV